MVPLTNIAENLAKKARLFFIVVRIGTDFIFSIGVIRAIRGSLPVLRSALASKSGWAA